MPLVYRPAREQDLERAQELVVGSINDLTERHGFGPMAVLRPTRFQSFSLKDDPDGLWLAEDAGEILGFALSWVCGDLWFLAELDHWVSQNRRPSALHSRLRYTWPQKPALRTCRRSFPGRAT